MMQDGELKYSGVSRVIFWSVAVAALFMFLGVNALWASEDRWAEITREMLVTGDWLHPAVNWRIYFDKPQLSYWFIIPFAKIFGMDELAARIPSALAALAGLYGTIELAKRITDRKTAVLSGWMLLSCYGFLFWGRTAAADMANMSAAVLAAAWFYYAEEKPVFWKYLVFYLIAFGGALTKGLPAFAVPVVMLAPHLLRQGRWLKHLKIGNFFAFAIGLLLYFLPFYVASVVPPAEGLLLPDGPVLSGIELVWRENIVRAFNAFDHKDPVYSYLYHLPRVLLPWAPVFVLAVIAAVIGRKNLTEKQKELGWGILLVFLMFTSSTSRRWYYILPLAPFCCIFTASMLYREEHKKYWDKLITFLRWLVIFAGAAGLASPIMLPVFNMMFKHLPPTLAAVSIPLAGLIILAVCMMDNKPGSHIERFTGIPSRLASLTVGLAVIMAVVLGAVIPSLTSYRTEKPFIRQMIPVFAGIPESSIAFYQTDSAAKFQFYMCWNGPTAVIWKQKEGEESKMREFILRNRGKKVVILCYNRKRELDPLYSELALAGIETDKLVPSYREPGKGKKWCVFLLNVPSAKAEKTEPQVPVRN